ncbi:MAG: DUF2855 family protein [Sphingomonadales bacterium]|nr:DUF2855 family protein [Sphingomonadales bacterium]MBD3775279.1 DUF2855 family protein [Paracoccaceae bacterium]
MDKAGWAIDIDKRNIASAALVDETPLAPGEGQVLARLDSFAMTANNVTYAAFGQPAGLFGNDKGYWDFFSPGVGPGRLPVWGFATITASRCADVPEGTEIYGYFPLASHVLLTPGKASPAGFADRSPHRIDMPPVYNQYATLAALDGYSPAMRDWFPVFRPLYLTGWMIADQLEDEGDFGALQVVTSGASSKTAIGFAHSLQARTVRPELVGLSSPGGQAFLAGHGLYDRVIGYDAITSLDPARPTVLVDIAGNPQVAAAMADHFGPNLVMRLVVGKAHWDAAEESGRKIPGAGFFAPGRVQKRIADWGPVGFATRMGAAWTSFMSDATGMFHIDRRQGAEAALAAYREAVAGQLDPATGLVVETA